MGLSDTEEVFLKHQSLCSDLNLDKEVSKSSWENYLATKHNYTLEGNQSHWLACALYVACRKTIVPTVGQKNATIEGNLVSLTQILRACNLSLIHFIDRCRKWTNMVSLTTDFRNKIDVLERKYAVSTVVYQKFRVIFNDLFDLREIANSDSDKMRISKKGHSRIICSASRLMEFTWTLYLVAKSEFTDMSEDLVRSYHLLLACCDMIYANAVSSDRRDILNRNFVGVPEHFFDDDYDPPLEPICIIDELCKNREGNRIDAKNVREYVWKPQMKKLFEKGILEGDSTRLTELLTLDVFDHNFRAVNRTYEQYVLSMGDFDERLILVDGQTENGSENRIETKIVDEETSDPTKDTECPPPPAVIPLTPLTGRKYLRNRDGNIYADSITPSIAAKENIIRLHTVLNGHRVPLRKTLRSANVVSDEESVIIENEIRAKVTQMIDVFLPDVDVENTNNDLNRARVETAEKLFYKILDDIALSEINMHKPDVCESIRQDLFLKTLFACAVEIVIFSHGCTQYAFPRVLKTLKLPAYHFYKIIELVVRTEHHLSRDMVKHLNMLEERILESMSWESDSPLWETIEESNMSVPSCEEVCLADQLSASDSTKTSTETSNTDMRVKPKRGGSLGLFFRKFYHLASVRMQDLCDQLNISDKSVRLKIWTSIEHVIVHPVQLMKDRHLDQIIMCTVYVTCRVLDTNLTFQDIMKCYRNQPQSASHIYRNVLITRAEGDKMKEERGDLIKFYNSVYVKVIQNFALKFSSKSGTRGEELILSPLPMSKSKGNSPRRISDKHLIYIRCLDNADSVAPSPVKPLSYYFSRSPANDLLAINNMIQINTVKRCLNSGYEEETPIKKVCRNDTTKLQDMMEDRRKYEYKY